MTTFPIWRMKAIARSRSRLVYRRAGHVQLLHEIRPDLRHPLLRPERLIFLMHRHRRLCLCLYTMSCIDIGTAALTRVLVLVSRIHVEWDVNIADSQTHALG